MLWKNSRELPVATTIISLVLYSTVVVVEYGTGNCVVGLGCVSVPYSSTVWSTGVWSGDDMGNGSGAPIRVGMNMRGTRRGTRRGSNDTQGKVKRSTTGEEVLVQGN